VKHIVVRHRAISATRAVTTAATTMARRRVRHHAVRRRRITATVVLRRVMPIEARHRAISAMRDVMTSAIMARRRARPRAVHRRLIIAIVVRRHVRLIAAHRHVISAMRAATRVTTGGLRRRVKPPVTLHRLREITAKPAGTSHALIAVRRHAKPHAAGLRRAITVARSPIVMAVAIPRIAAPCCVNMSAMPAVSLRSSGNWVAARRSEFRRHRATGIPTTGDKPSSLVILNRGDERFP
jgi:hypothetical protein